MDNKIKQDEVVSTLNDYLSIDNYSISTDFLSMNQHIYSYIDKYNPDPKFCWLIIISKITPFQIAVSLKLDKENFDLIEPFNPKGLNGEK